MKILVINGNPKKKGFIAGALNVISSHLETKDVEVQNLRLADMKIGDCVGCFHCLKTGACVLDDDMRNVIDTMLKSDGYRCVTGSRQHATNGSMSESRIYSGFPCFSKASTRWPSLPWGLWVERT